MSRVVVIDTNVVVSAGLKAESAPSHIVQAAIKGELIALTCQTWYFSASPIKAAQY